MLGPLLLVRCRCWKALLRLRALIRSTTTDRPLDRLEPFENLAVDLDLLFERTRGSFDATISHRIVLHLHICVFHMKLFSFSNLPINAFLCRRVASLVIAFIRLNIQTE